MALLLALLGHGVLVGLLLLLSYIQVNVPGGDKPQLTRKPSAVTMRPLSAEEWSKNRGEAKSSKSQVTERPRAKEKKEEKKEERPQGQVVAVEQGNNQKAPDAKYLAENDNKVDKETRARETTPFYRNAKPQRTAPQAQPIPGQDSVEQPQLAGNGGQGNDNAPMTPGESKSAFELPDVKRKQEIALKTDPNSRGPGMSVPNRNGSDEVEGNSKRLRIEQGTGLSETEGSAGRLGQPGLASLMPSQAMMDKLVGGAPNDHLSDVQEGDQTLLSTREWKHAPFFNRVKQSVGRHWNPNVHLRRRDPTGRIYSGKDRVTMVSVTLDEKGALEDIRVEKSSGLDFLDLEAVASFQRAQPFPNPPSGLLEPDSKVRFSFGFYLDMGGGPRMRLFREAN